jgi:ABC-type Fe3+ transport system permease subunit/sugar lactone lactonase YvrE
LNQALLTNSLLVAGVTSVLACVLGFAGALCLLCGSVRTRMLLIGAGILTLALPPFLVVNAWLDFLGPAGLAQGLHVNLLSFPGTVSIITLLFWPVPMLGLWMAWSRLDPVLLECEPAARGWSLLWHVLLPLGRSALGLAGALTFVLAINNFSVPSILQTLVYPTEIWIRYNTGLSGSDALVASWPLVLAPLIFLFLINRQSWRWPHLRKIQPSFVRRQLGRPWIGAAAVVTLLACGASVLLPLVQIGSSSDTWEALPRVVAAGTGTAWNSFFYAAAAASLCTAAGLLLAGLPRLAWARWGFWILFFLPGSVVGIGLLNLANPLVPSAVHDSPTLALTALTLRHLALSWTAVRLGYHAADGRLIDAARVDGASGWQLWRHAYWPQCWRYIAAGWYAVFLLSLWEVDSLILLAPAGGDTLAMRAFNLLHYGHTPEVNGICAVLLGLAVLPVVLASASQLRHRLFPWPRVAFASILFMTVSCAPPGAGPAASFESQTFQGVEVIGSRGAGPGQFIKPRSLALDANDNLYVADMTGRVQKFSPEGAYLLSWQMPQTDLGKPKGMCRDREGNIVVIEPHYSRLNHHSVDGELMLRWGEHGAREGLLAFPRAAGVNRESQIFVSEYGVFERVQRFQLESGAAPSFMNSFGGPGTGPGQFNRPEGLGVDPEGLVHVADSCNHRVQVFSGDGTHMTIYGKPGKGPGELSYPYDVCADETGLRFVCEFGNSRIQVFDRDGRSVEIIGKPGSKPGEFNNPWSIGLDSAGNLFVADSLNHRVQKLVRRNSPGGRQQQALRK